MSTQDILICEKDIKVMLLEKKVKELEKDIMHMKEALYKNSKNLPPGLVEEFCWWCNKSIFDVYLFRCKGCKVGRYCNKECQLNDWGRHQDYCWNEQERRETKKVFAQLPFDTSVAVPVQKIGVCWHCEKSGKKVTLFKCKGCMKNKYCSFNCQTSDWDRHGEYCRRIEQSREID